MREFKDTVTRRADKHFDDDDDDPDARAALGRPTADEDVPVDGEVVRERS
jgi:hypothetical protein